MKVLFAVSNENMSKAIIKKYQTEYKQIITYKNVYYFNAILKELQRDKTYDRVVISEDLEQYVNTDYEQMDKFLFDRLDSISDEASNIRGEDIPIILICTERRNKSEQILVKLFGIGIYNAIIGNDRSASEVCRLINRPRSKKEAKIYYKIDTEDVKYEKDNENDVSELEIQNILAYYKKIGNDEEKCVESFDSIASQYNETQLKVISKCLPLNVRAILEEKSQKYQQINSYSNNRISNSLRIEKQKERAGTSEILLESNKAKKLNEPVVIPSAIGANNKKKILTSPKQINELNIQKSFEKTKSEINSETTQNNKEEELLQDIELEELPEIKEIPREEYMPEIEIELEEIISEKESEEEEIKPKKRGRGRPKKIVTEPVEIQPKRKRGRPKKVVEPEENEIKQEDDDVTILPGFEEDEEEIILPGFDDDNMELSEKKEDSEVTMLPGFEDDYDESITLPEPDEFKENEQLPEIKRDTERQINEEYTNVLDNLRIENQRTEEIGDFSKKEQIEYPELNINEIINAKQKIVAFVGSSKNGTSFLINNVAELLSNNGVNTAILDLTQNRNAYYIYTKNEEDLRNQSNYIMNNLKIGKANGIIENKNLTIYTSPIENDENIEAVEPIVETLLRTHTVVLMDCDFNTPMKYFKYAQEIYLVQSMDILTIQPLTAFLRKLADKGMFEDTKARVVLNKFTKTKEINQEILIGGISIYNDASMTVRKELFNRRTVPNITIPFDLKTYLNYLDGLVTCDISLKGYSKEFLQTLEELANMVYPIKKKSGKYMPPSVKKNQMDNSRNDGFSQKMNDTLNRMKQNY